MENASIKNSEDMSLDEWLDTLFGKHDPNSFIGYMFPTDKQRDAYISTIATRSDADVKKLLSQFLIKSGSLGSDAFIFDSLKRRVSGNKEEFDKLLNVQFYRRLALNNVGVDFIGPWEGITWILDLLPDKPIIALNVLDAYFSAHAVYMPDGRISGHFDAERIIRAKWIGLPGSHDESVAFLATLTPRQFECIVERLYSAMEYNTILTSPQKDGGRDVIAWKNAKGHKLLLFVECKLRSSPVGVRIPREVLGVLSDRKANKGIIATNASFTKPAYVFSKQNPRLELLPGDQLVPLLNAHLGSRWSIAIESLVRESEDRAKSTNRIISRLEKLKFGV